MGGHTCSGLCRAGKGGLPRRRQRWLVCVAVWCLRLAGGRLLCGGEGLGASLQVPALCGVRGGEDRVGRRPTERHATSRYATPPPEAYFLAKRPQGLNEAHSWTPQRSWNHLGLHICGLRAVVAPLLDWDVLPAPGAPFEPPVRTRHKECVPTRATAPRLTQWHRAVHHADDGRPPPPPGP